MHVLQKSTNLMKKKKNENSETVIFSGGINRLQPNTVTVRLLTTLNVHYGIDSTQHSTSTVHRQSDLRPVDLHI